MVDKNDIDLHEVPYPATIFGHKDEIADDASRAWEDEFLTPLKAVLEDDDVKSIGFDTGTELFELKMMADHGKTIQILPELRTKTNYQYKGLLQALKRSKKNIILLHRLRDVWRTTEKENSKGEIEETRDKVQGMYEREGFNKTGFHVNAEVYLMHSASRGGSTSNQFGMRVGKSLQRPSLVTDDPTEKAFWNLEHEDWWWGREKVNGEKIRRASIPYLLYRIRGGGGQ